MTNQRFAQALKSMRSRDTRSALLGYVFDRRWLRQAHRDVSPTVVRPV